MKSEENLNLINRNEPNSTNGSTGQRGKAPAEPVCLTPLSRHDVALKTVWLNPVRF